MVEAQNPRLGIHYAHFVQLQGTANITANVALAQIRFTASVQDITIKN